ncbi:MAG: D-alanyl-D-alanine carboxypeptidase [Bacilli bacterium]|nr:D-alanyl-D-alanine carboxypeptidase [Bacilli bacterium]
MKKILLTIFLFFIFSSLVTAEEFASNAKSAVLMEFSTGRILFEKNSNEKLAPASMTKIMTMLLVMEALDEGKIAMDTPVTISLNASNMGGSQMFLDANSTVVVEELLKGLSIASANDAAVALAEKVGGSVDNFVVMMNEKAKELGLTSTNFVNPHGLDADGHYSSAKDMAIMARELIKHEEILRFTSTYEDYFNKSDGSRTWLVNTNRLVRFYPGVDGLKTGYTTNAQYCLTSTAKKNNVRYITVLMGEPSSDIRSKETTELLNYAFNSYKLNTILSNEDELGKVYVEKGSIDNATLIVKNSVTEVEEINKKSEIYSYNIKTNKIVAPVKKGDVVGTVEIKDKDGLIIKEEELTIKEDVDKISYIKLLFKNFKILLSGK